MAYRLGFVMEQTLGHVTHAPEFPVLGREGSRCHGGVDSGLIQRGRSMGTCPDRQAQLDAARQLAGQGTGPGRASTDRLDGLFFHTQVTAFFAQRLMARIPTVVSWTRRR